MYKQAIDTANKAGEGSKARRYGRGLKVPRLIFVSQTVMHSFKLDQKNFLQSFR